MKQRDLKSRHWQKTFQIADEKSSFERQAAKSAIDRPNKRLQNKPGRAKNGQGLRMNISGARFERCDQGMYVA
eukprot:101014-Pleurochrysis_carterae.AAC.9